MLVAAAGTQTMPILGDVLLAAAATGGALHVLAGVVCDEGTAPSAKAAALALVGTALQRKMLQADETLRTMVLFAASSPHAALRAACVELAMVRCV